MINSLFSDATGRTLISIRNVIYRSNKKYFPLDELMAATLRKTLFVDKEQIEDIMFWQWGDSRVTPLLEEMMNDISCSVYQVDHMWPKAILTKKKELLKLLPGKTEEERSQFKERCHLLPNLQLLFPKVNGEKKDKLYDEWLSAVHPLPTDTYYTTNLIPQDVSYSFDNFIEFTDARKKMMEEHLRTTFPNSIDKIVTNNGLTLPE